MLWKKCNTKRMLPIEKSEKASRKCWYLTWALIALILWKWGEGGEQCEQRARGKSGLHAGNDEQSAFFVWRGRLVKRSSIG